MNSRTIELSVVIPVYNSAKIFPELYHQLTEALNPAVKDLEIIAVLDGCKDDSFSVISDIIRKDPRVKLIEFSRNFGHQAAITAGLKASSGKMVAVIDDDLEDPPSLLPKMIDKIKEGYDVVYGIRTKRKRSFIHKYLYNSFYRILNRLVDYKMPHDAGDFCVMTSRIVDILNDLPERNMYLRGLRAWSGFKQTGIEYERGARFANGSGYNFRKYLSLAADATVSFSYMPLRLVTLSGFLLALAAFAYIGLVLVKKFMGLIADVQGWTTLIVVILFFAGMQMISIGILGEYIARIYDEVKQRPKYIVKKSVGLNDTEGK
jgi:polyisoprenyl-phosphate glycosyltransferase